MSVPRSSVIEAPTKRYVSSNASSPGCSARDVKMMLSACGFPRNASSPGEDTFHRRPIRLAVAAYAVSPRNP